MSHSYNALHISIPDSVIERASVATVADVLNRQVRARCGDEILGEAGSRRNENGLRLVLDIGADFGHGYAIEEHGTRELHIIGENSPGLVAGVGKFLRDAHYAPGLLTPGEWRGVSSPACPVRGIYFATHFHNFYQDAPVGKLTQYVEELGLWGVNYIAFWFDMHEFHGIDDPNAVSMLSRLHAITAAAKALGMKVCAILIGNEAFADSPAALRADWTAGHDEYTAEPQGHYHVELCPNKPGALELILKWRGQVCDAFSDSAPDAICIWPYDQGGCTCSACKPWGGNGFLTVAQAVGEMFKQRFPSGQVILSTWYFDHFTSGEWEALDAALTVKPDWADYLLADDAVEQFPHYPLDHGAPGGLPMVGFPEISMWGTTGWGPWGGFGASPYPRRLQSIWDQAKDVLAGGFPYSEGIFEDIGKAVCAQFYWSPEKPAMQTVREYIAYEFAPHVVEPVARAVELLETTLPRHKEIIAGDTCFVLENPEGVDEAYRLLTAVDAELPDWARNGWRWRILMLRGIIDYELVHNHFRISAACERALEELTSIYHAQSAGNSVAPPTKAALAANRSV